MAKPNPLQLGVALQKGKCVAGYQWTRQSAAARAWASRMFWLSHRNHGSANRTSPVVQGHHGVEYYPSTFPRHCNVTVNQTSASLCVFYHFTHDAGHIKHCWIWSCLHMRPWCKTKKHISYYIIDSQIREIIHYVWSRLQRWPLNLDTLWLISFWVSPMKLISRCPVLCPTQHKVLLPCPPGTKQHRVDPCPSEMSTASGGKAVKFMIT